MKVKIKSIEEHLRKCFNNLCKSQGSSSPPNIYPDIGYERLQMRVALIKIRKIRRDLTVPDHEQDEIYNLANEALNE